VTLEPYPRPSGVRYFLTRSTSAIKVWTESAIVLNNTDEEELVFGAAADPTVLWIEAAEPGASVLTLEVRDEDTGDVLASDSIRFFTFSSTVIVLTGEDRFGGGWGHGTTPIAEALYTQGYDAHLLSEEIVDENGLGDAYDEALSAVDERDVTEVALIGYSHGGGSVQDLATRLQLAPPTGPVIIPFTGYIDAIENDTDADQDSETALPPGTQFHVNLWQPVANFPLFVNGAPVPGSAIDINVNAPPPGGWGLSLDHSTIDDHPQVQAVMIQGVTNNVSR